MEEKRTKNLAAMDALLVGRGAGPDSPILSKPRAPAPAGGPGVAGVCLGAALWRGGRPVVFPVSQPLSRLWPVGRGRHPGVQRRELFLGCFLVVQCVLWQRRKQAGDLYGRDRSC